MNSNQQILDKLVNSSTPCFFLTGSAGTGKTYRIGQIAREIQKQNREVILLAPTGRAARILSEKTGMPASTIHSKIYTPSSNVEDIEDTELLVWTFSVKQNIDAVNAIYIIDESSMISNVEADQEHVRFGSGKLLSDLLLYIGFTSPILIPGLKRKVIFVGDPAQLPPVNSNSSPALDAEYLKNEFGLHSERQELTTVYRQGEESAILDNAIKIRASIEKNIYNKFMLSENADVQIVDNNYLQRWNKLIENNEHTKSIMIASTNSQAASHNTSMRIELFKKHSEEIMIEDRLMVIANNYCHGRFNGDLGTVKEVSPLAEVKKVRLKSVDTPVILRFRNVSIRFDSDASQEALTECKVLENMLWSSNVQLTREEVAALRVEFEQRTYLRYPSKMLYRKNPGEYGTQREKYLQAIRNDTYYNALVVKFGFAVTCHKAQGGEWDHVFVDFRRHGGRTNQDYFRWAYTAITRSRKHLYALFPPQITPFGVKNDASNKLSQTTQSHTIMNPSSEFASPDQTENTIVGAIPSALHRSILFQLSGTDVQVERVEKFRYMQRYHFRRGVDCFVVDYTYNNQGKITLQPHPLLTDKEISERLGAIKMVFSDSPNNGFNTIPQPFLKDVYDQLKKRISDSGITIHAIEHLSFKERYKFVQGIDVACIDIIYNASHFITSIQPVSSLTTSQSLADMVLSQFEELKKL